jgi:signal transduction histidine kinase
MTRTRRLAIVLAILAVAMSTVGIAVVAVSPTLGDILVLVGGTTIGGLATALALIVASRQPTNLVGALLAWLGLNLVFVAVRQLVWGALARHPETLAAAAWPLAVSRESAVWAITAVALLLLYFPDGRLPSRRWRWVPIALVVDAAAFHAIGALDPSPFPPPLEHAARVVDSLPDPLRMLGSSLIPAGLIVVLIGLLLACSASLAVRFRSGNDLQRTQLKWLMLAAAGLPAYLITCWAEFLLFGQPSWSSFSILMATIIGVPVATSVAVLRHDLYDVDKALVAAVTWGGVTAVLLGIYTIASFVVGVAMGRESTVAAAGATALAAVALAPLRKNLQRHVDRRLYPRREAALAAIEELMQRTHAGLSQPEDLEGVIRVALRDPGIRIGYLVPGSGTFVDAARDKVDAAGSVAITAAGVQIGLLVPGVGTESRDLLRQVGEVSAGLVDVVRLRLELAGALQEVAASRARLVEASEHERRRLERDLHDGAQQRLVALGMSLRIAQRHLSDGTVDLDSLLDQSVAELGIAVAELREIAHGLRPSRLDDGLHAALAGLTQNLAVPVELAVDAGPLPDDVAATAYFVASEAVTNAVKHAEAARIAVHVVRSDGVVSVRVADDGCGGAIIRSGSGLGGLADRIAAIGGSLALESPAGGGTVVEAVLPCGS